MAKAMRMVKENIKLIDVVIEIVDARAPQSCRNPAFESIFSGKARVIMLNKDDVADQETTSRWVAWYNEKGISASGMNSKAGGSAKEGIRLIEKAAAPIMAKYEKKGVHKTLRAMVMGIPNVGKSTFINCVSGTKNLVTGAKPGVTRGLQWARITPYLELMDTPGLLWPKLDDPLVARKIAYLGTINDEILDIEELASSFLADMARIVPGKLHARYGIETENKAGYELLESVCLARKYLLSGGIPDTERGATMVLDEFRNGKIGRISLEVPERQGYIG